MFTRLLPAQALRAHCLLPRKLPAAERTWSSSGIRSKNQPVVFLPETS